MDYNNKDWYYSPQTYPFYTPYQMQMQGRIADADAGKLFKGNGV